MTTARKRFGQHFLEPAWVDRVLAAAAPAAADRFIEIGPGRGALTFPLSRQVSHVTAVELDRDLVTWLHTRLPSNVRLVQGDFLSMEPDVLFPAGTAPGSVRLIGNLPYNISSPILFRLIDLHRRTGLLRDASLMLQREVAERVSAAPGSRDSGVLSLMVQLDADVDTVLTLPPGAFRPAPKVWSAVIRMRFRPPAVAMTMESRALFERLIRSLFAQRRKTVANALRPLATSLHADARLALARAGIDPSSRPETLHLADLAALAAALGSPAGSSVV